MRAAGAISWTKTDTGGELVTTLRAEGAGSLSPEERLKKIHEYLTHSLDLAAEQLPEVCSFLLMMISCMEYHGLIDPVLRPISSKKEHLDAQAS